MQFHYNLVYPHSHQLNVIILYHLFIYIRIKHNKSSNLEKRQGRTGV